MQTAVALRKLNINSVNQLINKADDKMISWCQLKLVRNEISKGRPARWVKRMKEIMIKDKDRRSLKQEFILPKENEEALQTTLDQCSNNRRKREWVILKPPRGKERQNILMGKVVASTTKKVLFEH